jgi:DNA (cytosine-5)-methyltransferase 1
VDVLHASPPCPSFSQAKVGAVETAHDIQLARQTAHFVTTLLPRVFTLENVWLYRFSRSWHIIEDALHGAGYWVSMALVNAADHGVPQTRKRMIVRAVRDGWVPLLPSPEPWGNWLDAIADLIDDLPETELAPWQVARLAQMPQVSSLFSEGIGRDHKGREYPLISRPAHEPAYTVTANDNMLSIKVLLMNGGNPRVDSNVPTVRDQSQPSFTITANQGRMPIRYIANAQIKAISPLCLARWQTIPDWYELPKTGRLAAKIIGNAVPPTLMERLYRDLI